MAEYWHRRPLFARTLATRRQCHSLTALRTMLRSASSAERIVKIGYWRSWWSFRHWFRRSSFWDTYGVSFVLYAEQTDR